MDWRNDGMKQFLLFTVLNCGYYYILKHQSVKLESLPEQITTLFLISWWTYSEFSHKLLSGILPLDQKPFQELLSSWSVSQPQQVPLTFGSFQWTRGFMGRCWRVLMDFMSPTSLMSNTRSELPSLYIQMVFWSLIWVWPVARQCGARLA